MQSQALTIFPATSPSQRYKTTTTPATRRQGMNTAPIHGTASATTNAANVYASRSVMRNGTLVPAD